MIDNELHNYLSGNYTDELSTVKAYEDLFRLKELNGVYDLLLLNYGLLDYKLPRFGDSKEVKGFNMRLQFKCETTNDGVKWKLSCRGYNGLCSLWGEDHGDTYEHDGHHFNEDIVEASRAFGGTAYHWDRHSSVWNVYKGVKSGDALNFDVHSEAMRKLASYSGVTLTDEQLKKARSVSKVLTFRVMFGGGIRAAVRHFKSTIDGHCGNDGMAEANKAMRFAVAYGLAKDHEELITRYYRALEDLDYIDYDFKRDQTSDVTVFYVETAVYIFAAHWLWYKRGIRALLKYDSFFTDKPVNDELMMEAIKHGMEMFNVWKLPTLHSSIDSRLWDKSRANNEFMAHVASAMDNDIDVDYSSIVDELKLFRANGSKLTIGAAEVCRTLGVLYNRKHQTQAASEAQHSKAYERMIALKCKGTLTPAERVAKSSFKKAHPAEYAAIFG